MCGSCTLPSPNASTRPPVLHQPKSQRASWISNHSLKTLSSSCSMPIMISSFSSYFRSNSNLGPRRGPSLFANLPTELCFLVFTHAARPTFAPNRIERKKPYSSALALCRVSRAIRCIVLPELLHTILLSKGKHVIAFIHALKMQHAYAQQDNHLHVDYAAHVRRIWIGGTHNRYSMHDIRYVPLGNTDFSLLAPVLLAARSLAIDYRSLSLLNSCLEYAERPHTHLNVDKSSPPPWRIKTLTLSGDLADYRLTDSVTVYAFLASISHIIFLSPTRFQFEGVFPWRYDGILDKLLRYNIFERISRNPFPWAALQNLQSVSLALPHLMPPIMSHTSTLAWCELCWKDVSIEMWTFTAPMVQLSGHWAQEIPDAYDQRGEGRISSANVRATLKDSPSSRIYAVLHWEQAWACGLRT